jgi:hypothetical protein
MPARTSTSTDTPALPARAARAALDQATTAIKRLQKDAARNHWRIGRRLLQVAALKLHRARGFARIEQYAEARLGLSPYSTFQYMRVAEAFGEQVAALYGPEKLDRALAYIARTREHETPRDVPELRIRIPGERGAPDVRKRFAEITIAELRRATPPAAGTRRTGRRSPGDDADADADVAATVARANRALDRAVGRGAASAADLLARAGDDGGVTIEVRGIPLARAAAAFAALAGALAGRAD